MKKVMVGVYTMLLLSFISCNEKNDENSSSRSDSDTERNIAAVNAVNNAIKTGDVSKLDQYLAEDAVDHASPLGPVRGADSIKVMLANIHTMANNMNMEVIKTLADKEYVFQWMRLTGTTATTDWGMPVGTAYDINAIQVTRFENGKMAEHWEFMQPADMARMMGSPGPATTDTSNTSTGTR